VRGEISLASLLASVFESLNRRRRAAVDAAFDAIVAHAGGGGGGDTPGDDDAGVPLDVLRECHDESWRPEVRAGDADAEDLTDSAMRAFRFDADGRVTRDEFANYCAGVSASVDGDARFAALMRRTWRTPE
jgi:hypothetical protein